MSTDGVITRSLTKEFDGPAGKLQVLRGIDFEARPGELTMLVGPSGCGKTTLISIIAGLLSATSGAVSIFGHETSRMSARELIAFRLKAIGFVFQQYNLLVGLSAAENAAVPLIGAGVPWDDAQKTACQMLEQLGLGGHTFKLPKQLSGGQLQRVAIARALVHQPKLLLCDEPTAALDAHSGQVVMALLRDLAVRPDRAAVVVTHDPRVYGFADRIVHMEDGQISRVVDQTPDIPAHTAGAHA